MMLAAAALSCPLVGATAPDSPIAHRVDMEGLPMANWGTAEWATARCGANVKLVDIRWGDLRTRGTPIRRCAGCREAKATRRPKVSAT